MGTRTPLSSMEVRDSRPLACPTCWRRALLCVLRPSIPGLLGTAQLLDDARHRPDNQPFIRQSPTIFGEIFERPAPCARRDRTFRLQPVTQTDPRVLPPNAGSLLSFSFRQIRRDRLSEFPPAVPPDGFPAWSKKPSLDADPRARIDQK
jgi:hypothetical protein